MKEIDESKIKRCEGCEMSGEVEEMNMPDGMKESDDNEEDDEDDA